MRVRIWPILLLGFSTLVVLIAFSGFSALERATGTYGGTTQLFAEELRTEQVLGRMRSDILLSAIAARDLLLTPKEGADAKREELRRLEASSRMSLKALGQLIPPEYRGRREHLETEVNEYWQALDPLHLSESVLRAQILPRRQAVLALAQQIEDLTRDSLRKRREDIDRRQADLPFYVAQVVGGTLLIGLLVAGTSVVRIARLEGSAERQHRAVVEAEEELRRLSSQLVAAQEEERRSLSRDLHDQIGQVLTAVRIGIGNVEEALHGAEAKGEVQTQLDQAKRLSEQALRSVRDIAMGLRPAMLDDLGLGAALEWQARQFSRLCDIPVSVEVQGDLEKLSEPQRTCIYRVVQEALNNVAKHANAGAIALSITASDTGTHVEIRDNGSGFFVTSTNTGGLGLVGIKERVRQLGGDTNLESKPGTGTAVTVWLPRTAPGAA